MIKGLTVDRAEVLLVGAEVYEGYDRISRVLDYFAAPDYVKWVGKVGNREAKRAGTVAMKIGTEVDLWIKAWIRAESLPKLKGDEANNAVRAFKTWLKEYEYVLTVPERQFDQELLVTGEPDLDAPLANVVIDIKCSTVIRPQYWLQTEFYGRQLHREKKAILRLDKHLGVYEYQERMLDEDDWEAVKGLVKAYKFYTKSLTEREENDDVTDTDSTDTEAGSKETLV